MKNANDQNLFNFVGNLEKELYGRLKNFILKWCNLIWVYKYVMLLKIFKSIIIKGFCLISTKIIIQLF